MHHEQQATSPEQQHGYNSSPHPSPVKGYQHLNSPGYSHEQWNSHMQQQQQGFSSDYSYQVNNNYGYGGSQQQQTGDQQHGFLIFAI